MKYETSLTGIVGPRVVVTIWALLAITLQAVAIWLVAVATPGEGAFAFGIGAAVIAFVAEVILGQALFAAGVDSERLRAIARFNLKTTCQLQAHVRFTRVGTQHAKSIGRDLARIGFQIEDAANPWIVQYQGYSGRMSVESNDEDNTTDVEFSLVSSPERIQSVHGAIETMQDTCQKFEASFKNANTNIHTVEIAVSGVAMAHSASPIPGAVDVVDNGAKLRRRLDPWERRRLSRYLLANVRLQ
ncbi:MAG: hypothetical protein ACYC2H_09510 [Thermoplasmatota archaeon]